MKQSHYPKQLDSRECLSPVLQPMWSGIQFAGNQTAIE